MSVNPDGPKFRTNWEEVYLRIRMKGWHRWTVGVTLGVNHPNGVLDDLDHNKSSVKIVLNHVQLSAKKQQ